MYYNKRKLIISILWVAIGITLLVMEMTDMINDSIYAGMGGGFLVIGIMQIIRNFKYNSNKEYREKIDIESSDERNRYLRMKAWSWAAYIFVAVAAIVSIVLFVMKKNQTGQIISYSMCALLLLYWISYMILRRKY